MVISIIACIAQNGGIGKNNQLLFHLSQDLHRFKTITMGHTVIMGRKTFCSLPHGPLPGRRNIVLSKKKLSIEGCIVCNSITQALATCQNEEEIFFIGGGNVYQQTIGMADHLYLTIVNKNPQDADTYFPPIRPCDWITLAEESHLEDSISYSYLHLIRRHHPHR